MSNSTSKVFWMYHCIGVALIFLLQLLAFSQQEMFAFNVSAAILWLPIFTFVMLLFRHYYRKWEGHRMGMGRLITTALTYGVVAGFSICVLLLVFLLPFFAEQFWGEETLARHNITRTELLVGFFVGNTFIQTLFISGWAFIYTTASASRRSKEAGMMNLKLQNSLREAELSNLSNQLNPHFLFNSLNNIRFVIHENPYHADAMVTALSEILRYSLASGTKTKVTVGQELEFIARYIDIVKLQLEDRLRYNLHCENGVEHYLMPPMMLQLLVENAVKHGMENLPQGGDLDVSLRCDKETLTITVVNPLPEAKANADGTGTGLKNIKSRLKLLYDARATLSITPSATHFSVSLLLPLEMNDESVNY